MTQQGMVLRRDILVGGGQRRVELAPQHRPAFEEGAALIFRRWTALQLGVQNEWGGARSADKANQLLADVIAWFYTTKGAGGGAGGRRSGRGKGPRGQSDGRTTAPQQLTLCPPPPALPPCRPRAV